MTKTLSIEFIDRISNITCFLGEYEDNELKEVFGWVKRLELIMESINDKPIFRVTLPHPKKCSIQLGYKIGFAAIKLKAWGVEVLWEE
jgi:hypothetical protein